MKEYYKIGEISKIYDIGKDSLMYYEELGILKPIRNEHSYRLYSITDLWRLNLIKELREFNFSMKQIKEYIDNRDIQRTKDLFSEELDLVENKIKSLLEKREEVLSRIQTLEKDIDKTVFDKIELKMLEERKAIILNGDIRKDAEADFLIKKLHEKFEGRFNILGNNNIGSVFSLDRIKQGDYDYYKEVFCFIYDEEYKQYSNVSFEKALYLCYTYKGDYSKKVEVLDKLFKYIKNNNLKIKDDPIEIYKIDIHETAKKEEFITEIQIEVEEM